MNRIGRRMSWLRAGCLMIWLAGAAGVPLASAAVAPGDIAIIGYQSDDPDALAFVVLTQVSAGETIRFTDSGWQSAGGFRAYEGGIQFVAPSDLPRGTVVSRSNPFDSNGWSINSAGLGSSGFALSTSGDQFLVFQGDAASPTFIYAINADSAGWSDATSSNTTALPPGLADGITAVNIGSPEADNGYYSGITSGTREELLTAISNPANWSKSDSPQTWPNWVFIVNGGTGPVPPVAYAGPDRTVYLRDATLTELMVDATAADANGLTGLTYAWTPVSGPGIVGWTLDQGTVTASSDPAEAQVTIDQTGVYTFTLTVTDPDDLVDTDTVTLTVVNPPIPGDYDEPAGYYDPARPGGVWYTGTALKSALHGIISGHVVRSYDAAKQALQLLDEDPLNSNNIILIYTGASVPKTWDGGVTWNREHMWPDSLNGTGDVDSDLMHLRPCNPSINSSRNNSPYGIGTGYWDPDHGAPDRGVAARALFYVETCYSNLTLVNGMPGDLQMGDLAKLVEWHYAYPVSEQERRRNHLIYDATDNPSYYQGNRNPFVDHPELVWSIWGSGPSDAKLYIGTTEPSDGASALFVDLGTVIKDAPLPSPQAVVLHKAGTDPTTYAITAGGDAASGAAGPRQSFVGGTGSRTISVGLSSSTATAGPKDGTLVIDDTEITSAGTGYGSADGDDTIYVTLSVLEHADASFASAQDQTALTLAFGSVPAATGVHTLNFNIYNIERLAGLTAKLDLDSVVPAGDVGVLHCDVSAFANLAAGGNWPFTASFDTSGLAGTYQSTYTLSVSDENLPGAASGPTLVLTLTGTIAASSWPPGDMNCDGVVNNQDIDAFVLALFNPAGYAQQYPACSLLNGDMNSDGLVNNQDIDGFIAALFAAP